MMHGGMIAFATAALAFFTRGFCHIKLWFDSACEQSKIAVLACRCAFSPIDCASLIYSASPEQKDAQFTDVGCLAPIPNPMLSIDEGGISYIASQMPFPPPRSSTPMSNAPSSTKSSGSAWTSPSPGYRELEESPVTGMHSANNTDKDRLARTMEQKTQVLHPSRSRISHEEERRLSGREASFRRQVIGASTSATSSLHSAKSDDSFRPQVCIHAENGPMPSSSRRSLDSQDAPRSRTRDFPLVDATNAQPSSTNVATPRRKLRRAPFSSPAMVDMDGDNALPTLANPKRTTSSRKCSTNGVSIVIGVRPASTVDTRSNSRPLSSLDTRHPKRPSTSMEIRQEIRASSPPEDRQKSSRHRQDSYNSTGSEIAVAAESIRYRPPDMLLPSPPTLRQRSTSNVRKSSSKTVTPATNEARETQETLQESSAALRSITSSSSGNARRAAWRSFSSFCRDFIRATLLIWTRVALPLLLSGWKTVKSSSRSKLEAGATPKFYAMQPSVPQRDQASVPFAERFKYLICTSPLLNATLSISAYTTNESAASSLSRPAHSKDVLENAFASPSSRQAAQVVSGRVSSLKGGDDNRSMVSDAEKIPDVEFNSAGKVVFQASLLAATLLGVCSPNVDAWLRSALLLLSFAWGSVAAAGVRNIQTIHFALSHSPGGNYSLSAFDASLASATSAQFLDPCKQARLADAMCTDVTRLLESAVNFDIECNKALSVVQEVELISRGYKLTHPMPPISRIEASSTQRSQTASPTANLQLGKSLLQSMNAPSTPKTPLHSWNRSNSRLSWQSSSLVNSSHIHHEGRQSPLSSPNALATEVSTGERLRMSALRKTLATTFEEASYALQTALTDLQASADEGEWALICEMYGLDENKQRGASPEEQSHSSDSTAPSSWTSQGLLARESVRPISPYTEVDAESSVGFSNHRTLSLLEGRVPSSTASKRRSLLSSPDPEGQSHVHASPIRSTGSRLSYVSERTPCAGDSPGPNQSGASKRKSYIAGGTPIHFSSRNFSASPKFSSTSWKREAFATSADEVLAPARSQLLVNSLRRESQVAEASNTTHLQLVTLKADFERMHRLRRSLLGCLMALDFSLKKRITVNGQSPQSFTLYWDRVDKEVARITATFLDLASDLKKLVHQEMGLGLADSVAGKASNSLQVDSTDSATNARMDGAQVHETDRDVQDRMQTMLQAMRSVQAKLHLCSHSMNLSFTSSNLHGFEQQDYPARSIAGRLPSLGALPTDIPEHERIFATIRDDLDSLRADWDSALNVLRSRRLSKAIKTPDPAKAVSGETNEYCSTLGSSESPQEAEEDAMRNWKSNQVGAETDMTIETTDFSAIEAQLARWPVHRDRDLGELAPRDEDELSALLLRSTSPQHLPAPGLEKVFEAQAEMDRNSRAVSKLTREERIRIAQQKRAEAEEKAHSQPSGAQLADGMMRELQAVMQNRKSLLHEAGKA